MKNILIILLMLVSIINAATTPKPFTCQSESFVSFNTSPNGPTEEDSQFDIISLADGSLQKHKVLNGVDGVNTIGYNVKDNYIWGYNLQQDKIVRIAADGNTQLYDLPAGFPADFYIAGDVDKNGILYLAARGANEIQRVNVDASSPDFLKALSPLHLKNSVTISTADIAFNPKDGLLYYIEEESGGKIYNIDPATGIRHFVVESGVDPYVVIAFFDVDGNFYFNLGTGDSERKLYKIDMNNPKSAEPFADLNKGLTNGDGARCANAPVADEPVMQPFTCDDTMYFPNDSQMGTNNGEDQNKMWLHKINRTQTPFSFDVIGEPFNKNTDSSVKELYNALAYNPVDNFLYALMRNHLVKIDKDAHVEDLGVVDGLPDAQFFAATFGKKRTVGGKEKAYYYMTPMNKNKLYKIDVESLQVVDTIDTTDVMWAVDITTDTSGDYIYYINRKDGSGLVWSENGDNQLAKVRITGADKGKVTYIGGHTTESIADTIFYDANDKIYVLYHEGGFYEIDKDTGKRTPISNAPVTGGLNDGAMCPNATVNLLPTIIIGDASVTEGGKLSFPVSLLNSDGDASVSFDYASSDGNNSNSKLNATGSSLMSFILGADYTSVSASLTTSNDSNIKVQTTDDTEIESDESLHLELSNVTGALYHDSNLIAKGTIIDNDKPKQGTCYATTDNYQKLFIYRDLNGSNGLVIPEEVNVSRILDGEGGGYRAKDGYIYQFSSKAGTDTYHGQDLYKINVHTGVVTLVKADILPGHIDAAEFYYDPAAKTDVLYVTDKDHSKLYTIETTNWTKTVKDIKDADGNAVHIGGLAIDPYSGQAYGMRDSVWTEAGDNDDARPDFYKLDLSTGIATFLYRLNTKIDAEGLAFADDGNLYLENEVVGDSEDNDYKIFKINIADGTLTPVAITGTEGYSPDTGNKNYVDIETLSCNGGVYQVPPVFTIITPEVMITEGSALGANNKPLVNSDENVTIVIKSSRKIRPEDHYSGEAGIRLNQIQTENGTAVQSGNDYSDFTAMNIAEADRTMLDGTDTLVLSAPMINADKYVESNEYFNLVFSIINQSYNKVTFKDGANKAKVNIIDDDYNLLTAYDYDTNQANPVIRTKIVNKAFPLRLVSLKPTGGYATTFGDLNDTKVKIVDASECVDDVADLNMTNFEDFNITGQEVTKWFTVSEANKNLKVQFYWKDKYAPRTSCSPDSFAVRPKAYELTLPTDLVAGKDFNVTVTAVDEGNHPVTNYEEPGTVYKLDSNETKVAQGCILGQINKTKTNFVHGISKVTVNYSDIGQLDFKVHEVNGSEYAYVDKDDTNDTLRYITPDSTLSGLIKPFHINLSWELLNGGGQYTYFGSDPSQMGAQLKTGLQITNEQGVSVKNFSPQCYAKDVLVAMDYNLSNKTRTYKTVAKYDINSTIKDQNMTFTPAEFHDNGSLSYKIEKEYFKDGNSSKTVKFNFERNASMPLNPLNLKLGTLNVSIPDYSLSTQATLDKTLTFLYARAHAPDQQAVGKEINALIYYEAYCKGCNRDLYGDMKHYKESVDAIRWYILPSVETTKLDISNNVSGEGSVSEMTPGNIIAHTSIFDTAPSRTDHNHIEIKVTKSPAVTRINYKPDSYLIFNLFNENATSQSFRTRFSERPKKWAGKGVQGSTVDMNVSRRINNKIDW